MFGESLMNPSRFSSTVLAAALLLAGRSACASGESTVPPPGIREHTPSVFALTGATIVTAPGQSIPGGTVIIRDGNIVAVGPGLTVPAAARTLDCAGKTVYAGFIDPFTDYGMPKPEGEGRPGRGAPGQPQAGQNKPGSPYWNAQILPEQSAARLFTPSPDDAEKFRGQGIALVAAVPPGSIMSGTVALITTGDGVPNDNLVAGDVALNIRFQANGWGSSTYPGSLMGVVALLRQSFLDAEWYTAAQAAWARDNTLARPENNQALARLAELRALRVPLWMTASDEKALLRSARLAAEWNLPAIIRGSNFEYRRLDDVKKTGLPVILPLDFPEAPAVGSPEEALQVSLQQLRHWYLAPANAARLHDAGVPIAFTGDGLKDRGKFLEGVRTSVKRGLAPDAALAALTTAPATMLGASARYGTIAAGKAANLVVTDGDLFDDDTQILETWVAGRRYIVHADPEVDVRGRWKLSVPERPEIDTLTLTLKGKPGKPSGSLALPGKPKLEGIDLSGARLTFRVSGDSAALPGMIQMSATVEARRMLGFGVEPGGRTFRWTAERTGDAPTADADDETTGEGDREGGKGPDEEKPGPLDLPALYPDGEFGRAELPRQAKLAAFTNATIWTCGPQGKIVNGTLLIAAGKVVGAGANLKVPADATVVDMKGAHITPGLIDCHSHTAIDGDVNESNQTISAEVRIGDVVDPDDIGIYRELAGGLTAANLLHGSANAIGGQNQVIKLRWGASAEEVKFAGAPPGIKFALGENPKQSNWGDNFTTRYPQTRMGVEEIIRDAFVAAGEYENRWKQYNADKKGIPPRRDLELDAIVEVLDGSRLVHCHSYRQDEILMLMRLAEQFGFRIATFQHILEGYKVADVMARHGVGGSSFSDWWAYKFEVYDAIPYNGALMHNEGVVVSFNSDSGELARRLNWEATKAVKYGGVPPEDALKFVTLNPARQLGVADRVGSLEPGKDADFAVWSGDPLSTYSRCEQTWIDGRKYFDLADDAALRDEVRRERAALIQRALTEKGKGGGAAPWGPKPEYSCSGLIEEGH
jgi:imidazolonepropionase-like amidohydrolase